MIPQHPKADSTNLCINCQHHHDDGTNKFPDRCYRPENQINPVNGQVIGTSCENQRFSNYGTSCGPSGAFFVERIASANSCTAQDSAVTS